MSQRIVTRYKDEDGICWFKCYGVYYCFGRWDVFATDDAGLLDTILERFAKGNVFFRYPDQSYAEQICAGHCTGWLNLPKGVLVWNTQ